METLETTYGRFTVYINPLDSEEERQFHISFVDKKNELHVILMREKGSVWVLVNPEKHPDWIIALRSEFERLITRELRSNLFVAMAS